MTCLALNILVDGMMYSTKKDIHVLKFWTGEYVILCGKRDIADTLS